MLYEGKPMSDSAATLIRSGKWYRAWSTELEIQTMQQEIVPADGCMRTSNDDVIPWCGRLWRFSAA